MNQKRQTPAGGPGSGRMHRKGQAIQVDDTTPPAEKLLDRLDKVLETSGGQYMCRCPAHDDRSPSLSIKETSDGTLLVKCFAGCETGDVLAAVGLELKDLFPRPLSHHRAPKSKHQRRRYGQALEALGVIAHEALVVTIAADRLSAGIQLDDVDRDRLHLARAAIQRAFALAGKPLPEPPCPFPELKPASDYRDELHAEFEKGAGDDS